MTTGALDIYAAVLGEQLGSTGLFTEPATYDPDGTAEIIYGIFEKNEYRDTSKDGGNVKQKKKNLRFIVSEITDFDIYLDKKLYINSEDKEYTINYVDKDKQGVQVLWLS